MVGLLPFLRDIDKFMFEGHVCGRLAIELIVCGG